MGNRIKYKIKTGPRTANDRFMIVIAVRSLFFRVYVNELMCIFRMIRINFPHHFPGNHCGYKLCYGEGDPDACGSHKA